MPQLSELGSNVLTKKQWQGLNRHGHKITESNIIPHPKHSRDAAVFAPSDARI